MNAPAMNTQSLKSKLDVELNRKDRLTMICQIHLVSPNGPWLSLAAAMMVRAEHSVIS